MFGLEGSGFVISIAMTFFLVGLVMYYVRQRLNDQEKQLNQIASIMPVMSQQIQLHESKLSESKNLKVSSDTNNNIESSNNQSFLETSKKYEKINVSDNDSMSNMESNTHDDTDSDADSDAESDTESDTEGESEDERPSEVNEKEVKNIKFTGNGQDITVADIETELGNQLQAIAMQESNGHMKIVSLHTSQDGLSLDLENTHNIEVIHDNLNSIDDSVDNSVDNSGKINSNKENNTDNSSVKESDSDIESDSDDDNSVAETNEGNKNSNAFLPSNNNDINIDAEIIDANTLTVNETDTVKDASLDKSIKNVSSIDYTKMAVSALRDIVVERQLLPNGDVSKLKKKSLIELLK